ncbi:hypothetical protein FACS1894216_14090 [Synergistales bacterium]|nr:hypothetical protein FACS1894216_14090 [Synergistales bacterium]
MFNPGSDAKLRVNDYKIVQLSDVSVYDPYVSRKQFIPTPQKRGLVVNLGNAENYPIVEMVIGAGTYSLAFCNDGAIAGSVIISPRETEDRAVIEVPKTITDMGYDALAITPLAGKSFFVAYVGLLDYAKQSVVNNSVPPRKLTAFTFSPELNIDASQHDITGVLGYFVADDGENLRIQAQSISELDVELLAVVTDKGKTVAEFPEGTILETAPISRNLLSNFTAKITQKRRKYQKNQLYLEYRYADSQKKKTSKINPFMPHNDEVYYGTEMRTTDNLDQFDFVRVENGVVTFEGDIVSLDRKLFIPTGLRFVLRQGQTVDLSNGAAIICRSAVEVTGTEGNPARLISSDGTGQGILVLQAKERSTLNYLICNNLGEIHSGIYALTGAVTFYESDAEFYGCQFLNNRSEDGLNIVRSKFYITNSIFFNAFQDAFDSDFCTGTFENCYFRRTGNDALDVSTTKLLVLNCVFRDISDKAISVGEASAADIENIRVINAQAGIGVKDNSNVTAKGVFIKDAFIGYVAYQKKPEFGSSKAEIENFSLSGKIDFDFLIEKNEILIVDGKRRYPRSKKKEALIISRLINEEPIQ